MMWGELPGALTDDSFSSGHRPCWNCTFEEQCRDFEAMGRKTSYLKIVVEDCSD